MTFEFVHPSTVTANSEQEAAQNKALGEIHQARTSAITGTPVDRHNASDAGDNVVLAQFSVQVGPGGIGVHIGPPAEYQYAPPPGYYAPPPPGYYAPPPPAYNQRPVCEPPTRFKPFWHFRETREQCDPRFNR